MGLSLWYLRVERLRERRGLHEPPPLIFALGRHAHIGFIEQANSLGVTSMKERARSVFTTGFLVMPSGRMGQT